MPFASFTTVVYLFATVEGNALWETAQILASDSEITGKFKQFLDIIRIPQEDRLALRLDGDIPLSDILRTTLWKWKSKQSLDKDTVDAFVGVLEKGNNFLASVRKIITNFIQ